MKRANFVFGVWVVLMVIALLAVMELVAHYILPETERLPLFYIAADKRGNAYEELNGVGFDRIDPLTGWSMSDSLLSQKGFKTENGNVVLQTSWSFGRQLTIYISGGSTTDLAVIADNWPAGLLTVLDSNHVNAKIVIGSVGGYNTGQELLKFLSYDYDLNPDVHISYCGANEVEPFYVSNLEQNFYRNGIHPLPTPYLPNTVYWLRNSFSLYNTNKQVTVVDYYDRYVKLYTQNDSAGMSDMVSGFWLKNMQAMHSLAAMRGKKFIGILQPVQGGGTYTQTNDKDYAGEMIRLYKQYYPALAAFCKADTTYLVDMKNIFDQTSGKVFSDDCHLHKPYQNIVAHRVYRELEKRGLISSAVHY